MDSVMLPNPPPIDNKHDLSTLALYLPDTQGQATEISYRQYTLCLSWSDMGNDSRTPSAFDSSHAAGWGVAGPKPIFPSQREA